MASIQSINLEIYKPLYQAQQAAKDVFATDYFPCFSEEYIQSFQGFSFGAVSLYSKVYNLVRGTYELSEWALTPAFALVHAVSSAFERIVTPVADRFYPINPINHQRHMLLISRSWEKWLGDFVFYPVATLGLSETHEINPLTKESYSSEVDAVTQRLLAYNRDLLNPTEKESEIFDYKAMTVASSQVNAFAAPGGKMVVFTQIIKEIEGAIKGQKILNAKVSFADGSTVTVDLSQVTKEDVMAALLGHEMTHAASRHGIVSLVKDLLTSFVLFVGRIAFMNWARENQRKQAARKKEETPVQNQMKLETLDWVSRKVEGFLRKTLRLFNSKQNEYEADVTGAFLAKRAGFNPLGALFLQELLHQGDSFLSDFWHKHFEVFCPHPYGEKRKRALFAAIKSFSSEKIVIKASQQSTRYDRERSSLAVRYVHQIT